MHADAIAAAFEAACRDEIAAPKPGNVHVFADGHRMKAADFLHSAAVAAAPIATPGARIGVRILGAVTATAEAIGTNTNLGIVLLCAPLAAAAEQAEDPGELRPALAACLRDLDRDDAEHAFAAIRRARPAGLGQAPRHDVFAPAQVGLREAMAEAAARDAVARQYVNDFADIFDVGLPELVAARARWREPRWATLAVYLAFLSAFPDSHVARKHGSDIAEETRRIAIPLRERLHGWDDPALHIDDVLACDASLKRRGINPGTSADLTVATLFARHLTERLADLAQQ